MTEDLEDKLSSRAKFQLELDKELLERAQAKRERKALNKTNEKIAQDLMRAVKQCQ